MQRQLNMTKNKHKKISTIILLCIQMNNVLNMPSQTKDYIVEIVREMIEFFEAYGEFCVEHRII